jgi:GT2 family glycosyltransferase
LRELVSFLDGHPEAGLACPIMLDDDGVGSPPASRFPAYDLTIGRVLRRRLRLERDLGAGADRPFAVDWVWTTGYVCRRAAFSGQLFSEQMFLFGEEYALCRGLRDAGFRLFVVPSAQLLHHGAVTWSRSPDRISMARRLGMAALWTIRRSEFGGSTAALSQAVHGAEAAVIWGALRAKRWLTGQGRPLLEADYAAQAGASLALLIQGERYVSEINARARRFFNEGRDPPPLHQYSG